MLNILFVTPAFPPFTGGGERYARSLALAIVAAGHRVTVVTSSAQTEADFWQGAAQFPAGEVPTLPLTLIRCPLRPLPLGRTGLLAWRKGMVLLSALPGDQSGWLRRMAQAVPPITGLAATLATLPDDFDLVVGFNLSWEHAALAAWQFARQRRRPFVLVPFAHLGEGRHTRMARNATMDHQRHLLADADSVLALTEAEVAGFAAWGIVPRRIDVVGSGLDPTPALTDPAGIVASYDLQTPFALFIGRVNYDKGAIHAAQAAIALRRQGLPLTLALVGRTATDFDKFYSHLSPAARQAVRPLGVVSEEAKHSLLSQASLLLLPSRTDSFGIVLLEAWSHSKPVVGASVGGVGSVISDGQDGLLVPFGDVDALGQAISRLVSDDALNRRLGAQGQAKLQARYTWERVAERVLANFAQLVPRT